MKRIAVIAFIIVAVVVVAVGALAVFPPKELVKGKLVQQVRDATGRELAINGPMSLRLLPSVVMRLENVQLKNPPGPARDPLFSARAVLVEAGLWQLLMGRRTIDRVSLEEPRFALLHGANGEPNWTMKQQGSGGAGHPLTVTQLAIANGSLAYRDERSGDVLEVGAIDGSAKHIAGERVGELTVNGAKLSYQATGTGTKVAVDGLIATATALGAAEAASVVAKGREVSVAGATPGPSVVLKTVDLDSKGLTAERIGEITLKASTLLYRPADGGPPIEVEGPQGSAKAISRSGPLDAAFGFDVKKERIAGNIKLQSPTQAMSGTLSPASARLTAPKGTVSIDGQAAVVSGGAKMEGKATASSPSLRELATWIGVTLPKTGIFGAASIEGNAKVDGKRIVFENGKIALDDTKATGSITVDLDRPRPFLSGQLTADAVDVDSYFEPAPTRPPAKKPRARELPVASPPTVPPGSEKEALKGVLRELTAIAVAPPVAAEAETGTRGVTAGNAWSDDPIDLSGLKAIDADLSISVVKLTIFELEVGVPDLKAALKDGVLSVDGKNLAVEGAQISGTASIDARDTQAKLAAKFKAQGIDPKAVFEALGQEARILGKSSLEADLSGSGNSARKVIGTLNGKVKAATNKGAIVGYDLNSLWGGIAAAFGGYDPKSRTPFDALEANLALTDGVASKSSVEVTGPILGVDGNGIVRLPSREIDYRLQLKLLSWGQSAAVRVLGGWLQPKVNIVNWGSLGTSRSLQQSDPLEPLKGADLKDPELARLAAEVLKKAASKGELSPQVTEALEQVKARAEGRK